jgi:hypothetical protein
MKKAAKYTKSTRDDGGAEEQTGVQSEAQSGITRKIGEKSRNGYILYPDGSIEVSPGVHASIMDIIAEQEGIDQVLDSVVAFAMNRRKACHKSLQRWWALRREDLEIVLGDGWRYNHHTGRLMPPKPEPEPKQESATEPVTEPQPQEK